MACPSGSGFFNRIKQCRRVATRTMNCLAFVQLASMRLWLRAHEPRPNLVQLRQQAGHQPPAFGEACDNDMFVEGVRAAPRTPSPSRVARSIGPVKLASEPPPELS